MPNLALSPAEVIAAEAVSGKRSDRFPDMLGIASVIANRANALNTTLHNVVSVASEFNAYGKAMPKGTSGLVGLAQEAIDYVQTHGPVTTATFYATPAAAKNLPSGLTQVSATKGHQFYEDTQNRSIRTGTGYLSPVIDPAASLPATAPTPTPRQGLGMEALAPSYSPPTSQFSTYDRSNLDPSLNPVMDSISGLVAAGVLPDIGINSGYRSPETNARAQGARHSQHMNGKALDIDIRNLTDEQKSTLLEAAVENGVKGVGIYPSGNVMHIDTRENPAVWGGIPGAAYRGMPTNMAPGWARSTLDMMMSGGPFTFAPISAPVPTPRPDPFSAPLGAVEHGASLPAPGQYSPLGPQPGAGPYSPTPPSLSGLMGGNTFSGGLLSSPQDQVAADLVGASAVNQVNAAPSAQPSRSTQAPSLSQTAISGPAMGGVFSSPQDKVASGLLAQSALSQAGIQPTGLAAALAPTPPQATVGPTLAAAAALPAPVSLPAMAPVPTARPAPVTPVAPPVVAPVPPSRPAVPSTPQFSPADIWGGAVGSARASNGSIVSRGANDDATYVTNPMGVTTATLPNGMQAAVFGSVPSVNAPVGTQRGSLADRTQGSKVGSAVQDALGNVNFGQIAGAMIGGALLGPVGGLLGGFLGGKIGQSPAASQKGGGRSDTAAVGNLADSLSGMFSGGLLGGLFGGASGSGGGGSGGSFGGGGLGGWGGGASTGSMSGAPEGGRGMSPWG